MKTLKLFWLVAVFGLLAVAGTASASEKCDFIRDLDLGVDGEDVRCLQKYLNSSGFVISNSGPGAPGGETSLFRTLTKEALAKWQAANGLVPASGYFGPLSRQKYLSLNGEVGNNTSELAKQAAELRAKLDALKANTNSSSDDDSDDDDSDEDESDDDNNLTSVGNESTAKKKIKDALKMIREAEQEIDSPGDGADVNVAQDNLDNALEDLIDAVSAYFNGNYAKALDYADDSYDNALDAFEDAGGETVEDEVEELIDEIKDDLDAARNEVEVADDDGKDVDEAEDLLDEAEDKLDEAEELLDDNDPDAAEEAAKEADDLIDEALDSVDEADDEESEAEDAIEDAQDAIDEAEDAIAEAEDDGDDTGDAEDLLDEAQDLLDEAEEAFDDEDYDEALDLAEEAEDLANDAIDEI